VKLAKRNLLLLALASALAAAAPACSSSDDTEGGGGGSGGLPDTGTEDCFNGVDDDADGAIDCLDPSCLVIAECTPDCTGQVPGCEGDQQGAINRVCVGGSCEAAGQISEDGALLRGSVVVYSTLVAAIQAQAGQNKAYLVEFFHPVRPDGSQATCDDLFEAGRSGAPVEGFNVVGSTSGSINVGDTTIPSMATGIPVEAEGSGWLMLSRLYGARDNGMPAGELVGLGCQESVIIPAGEFVDDAAHAVNVSIQPVCSPSDPNSCPGELTCKFGALVCRDERCVDCVGSRVICRDVDGSAECLQRCDPETIGTSPCPADHRCDTTPGYSPACIPLGAAD
jgi:hypothetical protein